jgi:chromosome segregation ATPase
MGSFIDTSMNSIEQNINSLNKLYSSLRYQETRADAPADFIEYTTKTIQQHKDRLVELATAIATESIEKAHITIAEVTYNEGIRDNKDMKENREYAIKCLQDAIAKATDKPYEADEKIMKRFRLERRLVFVESEIPYLEHQVKSPYSPPETFPTLQQYKYESHKIREILATM